MNQETKFTAPIADREIVLERVFDAPRARVYRAWTDPEHVGTWWGPNGFTNTIYEMDVRPGGVWRFMMHGPGGVDYPNRIVYVVVEAPERLVYDHGDEDDFPQFRVTTTFEEEGTCTRVRMQLLFPTAEACERTKQFGAIESGRQTLGRLAEYLPTMPG